MGSKGCQGQQQLTAFRAERDLVSGLERVPPYQGQEQLTFCRDEGTLVNGFEREPGTTVSHNLQSRGRAGSVLEGCQGLYQLTFCRAEGGLSQRA